MTPAGLLAGLDRGLGILAGLFAAAGAAALAVLLGVTVVAVVWRYALNAPIFGIEDVSTMALVVVVAASVAHGARRGAHIAIDLIGRFGRRLTRLTDVAARALGAGMLVLAAWALADRGSCGLPCGAITSNLGIAHTPFYHALAAALGLHALVLLLQLALGLIHWSGEDPNEPRD